MAETETKDESNSVTQLGEKLWEFYLEQNCKIEQERLYPEAITLGLNQQEYKGYLKGTIIDALREELNTSALKKARNHFDTLIEMMEESSC